MKTIEKCQKLIDYSVLFTDDQKRDWLNLLPRMNEDELLELYNILADEVKTLKKEGIEIIPNPKAEEELVGKIPSVVKPISTPQPPGTQPPPPSTPAHGASIQSLKAQVAPAVPKTQTTTAKAPTEFSKEVKREVETKELQKPAEEKFIPPPKPPAPPPPKPPTQPQPPVRRSFETEEPILRKRPTLPPAPPVFKPQPTRAKIKPTTGLATLNDIKTLDDLKRIQVAHLSQGALPTQIEIIKTKMLTLAKVNKILPYYAMVIFEQSPLYKTYLSIGSSLIGNPNPDRAQAFKEAIARNEAKGGESMALNEFEAIADLRNQMEQL